MSWNYGDILDAVGAVVPHEKPCLIHDAMDDTQVVSWGDFNRRTNNLARRFLNRHAQASDKVAPNSSRQAIRSDLCVTHKRLRDPDFRRNIIF